MATTEGSVLHEHEGRLDVLCISAQISVYLAQGCTEHLQPIHFLGCVHGLRVCTGTVHELV